MSWIKIRRRTAGGSSQSSEDDQRLDNGMRSIADLIAPAMVDVRTDHLRLEDQYARVLSVTGYPRTVTPGWLGPLLAFEEPIEISLHIHPLDSTHVQKRLRHKMVQLESSRMLDAKSGRVLDPEREVAYEDVQRLREALGRGEERVFSVSLYILVRARSQQELNDLTRKVESLLGSMLVGSRVAWLEQDTGFVSCLPEGRDRLLLHRNLDTSSLATTFPFVSANLSMERGVLYGIAKQNQSLVIFDPFDDSLENANAVVFAKSGSGKSYWTKLMALRNLLVGVDFLIIDPEDEYRTLCDAVGGQYVRLSVSSRQHINPFDLSRGVSNDDTDPLAEHIKDLRGWLQMLLTPSGEPLHPRERTVLDQALRGTFVRAGITDDPDTHSRPSPLLTDLVSGLQALNGEVAEDLAMRLWPYTQGSLAGLFSSPTNVSLKSHFVVFNIHDLGEELRPLAIHTISSFVWNQVRRSLRPRLLIIDEAWSLMQHEEGGRFLAGLARRARKRYLGLVAITQDIKDFLNSEHGHTVLANSSLKLLMKHDGATVDPVVQAFRLSDRERQFLLGAGKGEGLFFARDGRIPIKVDASPAEHALITTAPRELAARQTRSGSSGAGGFSPHATNTQPQGGES